MSATTDQVKAIIVDEPGADDAKDLATVGNLSPYVESHLG